MAEEVEATVIVVVDVNDEEAITRCTENTKDDPDDDRPDRGWRDLYYDLREREDVLRHLAFNCIANGIEDASRLDGWADLPMGAVTMRLDRTVDFL